MRKISVVIFVFLVSLGVILFQTAFGTTFRVETDKDKATIIRVVEESQNSSHGTGTLPWNYSPIVDTEGNCINCSCDLCHSRKQIKVNAEKTVEDHFKIYWPKNEYRLKEGEKVPVLTSDAYVVKRKGRLVLYDHNKPSFLSSKAKIIKAGKKFFILE